MPDRKTSAVPEAYKPAAAVNTDFEQTETRPYRPVLQTLQSYTIHPVLQKLQVYTIHPVQHSDPLG